MMSYTPPPLPGILDNLSLDQLINNFIAFWTQSTSGFFAPVIMGLVVVSVFLKTRSLSATGVAALAVAAAAYREWLLLVAALALAGLLWGLWARSGE